MGAPTCWVLEKWGPGKPNTPLLYSLMPQWRIASGDFWFFRISLSTSVVARVPSINLSRDKLTGELDNKCCFFPTGVVARTGFGGSCVLALCMDFFIMSFLWGVSMPKGLPNPLIYLGMGGLYTTYWRSSSSYPHILWLATARGTDLKMQNLCARAR